MFWDIQVQEAGEYLKPEFSRAGVSSRETEAMGSDGINWADVAHGG